jgi:plastocyanin
MRMRARFLIPLAALGVLALPSPAPAANQTVRALDSNVFVARNVAVRPGERVSFVNVGGDHNVVWNDNGVPPMPSTAVPPEQWTTPVERTFARTGRYRYFCDLHGGRTGSFGMIGFVYVNAAGLLPPTLTSVGVTRMEDAVRLRFRASRAGTATAVFSRRVGRSFVRFGSATFAARSGFNSRLITRAGRALREGSWRVTLTITDVNRLRSDPRTVSFTLV